MSFKNKILRIICDPVNDNDLGCLRRRMKKETRKLTEIPRITDFVKAQRIQWFGHVERRPNSESIKATADWKPTEKRPRGRVLRSDG